MAVLILTTGCDVEHAYTALMCISDDICVKSISNLDYDIQHMAQELSPHIQGYSHIVCVHSQFLNAVFSYMAMELRAPMLSNVMSITDGDYTRKTHAGSVVSTVRTKSPIVFMGIDAQSFDGYTGKIEITPIQIGASKTPVRLEYKQTSGDLASADKVIVVGGGVQAQQDVDIILQIAQKVGAKLGATAPVITAGLLPAHMLVGERGTQISPDIYVGIGVSGASHHMSCVRAKMIIAVNVDETAPLCRMADYIIHSDYHEVLDNIKALLSQ